MPRELKPCGTVAAYQRHLARGETPCPACARERREYARQRPRSAYVRRTDRARQRALKRLAQMFPAQFDELFAEERRMAREEARDDAR